MKQLLRIEVSLIDDKADNGVELLKHDVKNVTQGEADQAVADLKDFLGIDED